jgi:hypothetical protein
MGEELEDVLVTVYLPKYTKDKLESEEYYVSADWEKGIPYRKEPESGFLLQAIVDEETLYDDQYHPGLDEDVGRTINSMQEVELPIKKEEKKYEEPVKASKTEEPKTPMVEESTIEKILKESNDEIKVSGKTLLYTTLEGADTQIFFDQDGDYVTYFDGNDASYRSEYQEELFTHFGIIVEYFNLPSELDDIIYDVANYQKKLAGEFGVHVVIDKIIKPYLLKTIKKK